MKTTLKQLKLARACKDQVEAAAKKAGFVFEVDSDSVFIGCPDGFEFADQTYGERYSEWPTGKDEDYTKAYCYECCMEIIAGGMVRLEE